MEATLLTLDKIADVFAVMEYTDLSGISIWCDGIYEKDCITIEVMRTPEDGLFRVSFNTPEDPFKLDTVLVYTSEHCVVSTIDKVYSFIRYIEAKYTC